jgi:hypothetical protein
LPASLRKVGFVSGTSTLVDRLVSSMVDMAASEVHVERITLNAARYKYSVSGVRDYTERNWDEIVGLSHARGRKIGDN